MKRLAIIGAGAAGLAAAQRLRTTRPNIDIVVLEKKPWRWRTSGNSHSWRVRV